MSGDTWKAFYITLELLPDLDHRNTDLILAMRLKESGGDWMGQSPNPFAWQECTLS